MGCDKFGNLPDELLNRYVSVQIMTEKEFFTSAQYEDMTFLRVAREIIQRLFSICNDSAFYISALRALSITIPGSRRRASRRALITIYPSIYPSAARTRR